MSQANLNLSAEQEQALADKQLNYRKKVVRLRADLRIAQLERVQVEQADKPQMKTIKKKIGKINEIREQIDLAQATFEAEIRTLLTPEQWEQWKQHRGMMRGDMMASMEGGCPMMSQGGHSMMGGHHMMNLAKA